LTELDTFQISCNEVEPTEWEQKWRVVLPDHGTLSLCASRREGSPCRWWYPETEEARVPTFLPPANTYAMEV
jgi:hypothetical protein